MFKVDKKLILLLILVLTMGTLGGCDSTPKEIPDGVSEDFYDDMIACLKKLEKYRDNEDKNGKDVIQDYLDNKVWLSSKEEEIIKAIDDMYFDVWFYHIADEPNEHMVKNAINEVADLMNIKIDTKKLINKK